VWFTGTLYHGAGDFLPSRTFISDGEISGIGFQNVVGVFGSNRGLTRHEFFNACYMYGNPTLDIHLYPIGLNPEIDVMIVKRGCDMRLCPDFKNFVQLLLQRVENFKILTLQNMKKCHF